MAGGSLKEFKTYCRGASAQDLWRFQTGVMAMSKTWQKILAAALILCAVVLAIGFILWLTPFLLIKSIMADAYRQLILASVPRRLAFGILLLAGTPFILAMMRLFSLRAPFLDDVWPPKKLHAFALVGLYVGGFSLFMYGLTKDQHFAPGQKDYVCVVDYKFFEHDGLCPVHGKELQAVTPEIVEIVQGVKRHGLPHEIDIGPDGPFVDAATGQPMVWFGEREGRLVPYSGPGFDPINAARLSPATPDLVARFRESGLRVQAQEQERHSRDAAEERALARRDALEMRARSLEQGLVRDPGNAELAYSVGELYARAGDRGKAIEAFKKALWIDPGMEKARSAIKRLGGGD